MKKPVLLHTSVARANAELALIKAQKALDDATKAQRSKQYQVVTATVNPALQTVKDYFAALQNKDYKAAADLTSKLWPVTFENNRWLYNRNNLIDFHSLTTDEQTMAGLRVRPVRLARNSDHMALTLPVQNTTNVTSVLGQTHEILAAFTFPHCLGELDDRSQTGLITTINLHQRTKRT